MKNNYFIRILTAIFLCSGFSLHAMEENRELSICAKRVHPEIEESTSSEEKKELSKNKRPRLSFSSSLHDNLLKSSSQIYSIPTYDATFKYMLSDPAVCLSFLKTFTLKSDIQFIERLDEHLRPVQGYQSAQQLINDPKSKKLMERINKVRNKNIEIIYTGSKDKKLNIKNGAWFVSSLAEIYGDILSSFPTPERNSAVDILCRLDSGSLALVEVQVVEQDYWDQRALAYAASVYSRQMRKSDKWDELQEVICINILGGGLRDVQWDTAVGFKHYTFKDQHNSPISGGIEILQYPLYYSATVRQASAEATNDIQKIALEEWMDFLEHASKKKEKDVTTVKTEGLKEAYEMVKTQNLPQEIKEANEKQDEEVFKRSARIIEQKTQKAHAQGHAQGIEEGERKKAIDIAKNMLSKGMSLEIVSSITDLSVNELTQYKSFLEPAAKERDALN